ncbi:MAG: BspA family leucine-rich repeat surface protein [Bacilli bacterium]|nr:BspA family leucine-rich repeat surface protein [Bacilli bacterium]
MRKYHYYNLFAFVILVLTTFMSIGYSAISTNLKISGDVAFMKAADIRVTSASLNGVTNSGAQKTPVSFDYTSISGGISLPNLNSTVTITVKTKNYVALDKEITSITNTAFSNLNIEYTISGYSLGDKILGNATTTFTITFKYKSSVTTVPSIKTLNYELTFNFNNYILNMMIGNTGKSSADAGYNWLSGPINSLNIETISFTTTNSVPSTALGSWDVSVKQNGSIKAWYFDSNSNSKYEVVIGSMDGAVLASDLTYFAYYLQNLYSFNAANLNISKITSLSNTFCTAGLSVTSSFTISNISSWDTSNITSMNSLFYNAGRYAISWNVGTLTNWNTGNVTDMTKMFGFAAYTATSLNIGNLNNWDVSNVTNMTQMFMYIGYSATTWNIGNLSGWNTSKVKSMPSLFYQASHNASSWSVGDLSNWNTSSVTNMSHMFDGAGRSSTTWNIGNISGWNVSGVKNFSYMFNYAGGKATSFNIGNISNWNTSSATNFKYMFCGTGSSSATSWSIGNLSNWVTTNVTDMSGMFAAALESKGVSFVLDLSSWNTSNVKDMSSMFYYTCMFSSSVTTFNLGNLANWNTSKVENMHEMFYNACYNASTWYIGNISNWNVSNVTDMQRMFSSTGAHATSVNIGQLTNWNLSKVTNVLQMFDYFGGASTTTINLGTITLYNVVEMNGFMMNCTRCNATVNLRGNPTNYNQAFWNTSQNSGKVTVNYTSAVTSIDAIIATKSSRSNVVKGSLIT